MKITVVICATVILITAINAFTRLSEVMLQGNYLIRQELMRESQEPKAVLPALPESVPSITIFPACPEKA
jgi:hypothetical protein